MSGREPGVILRFRSNSRALIRPPSGTTCASRRVMYRDTVRGGRFRFLRRTPAREVTMAQPAKGRSPFCSGQPVPFDLFVGRAEQIDHILTRGVGQVAAGKPVAMFIEGEYGIGKSSIAGLVQRIAEREHGLHGIYAPLGSATNLDEVGAAVLRATIGSGASSDRGPSRSASSSRNTSASSRFSASRSTRTP